MQRHAFKMYLLPGSREEYKKRHDEIWPKLSALLTKAGISNYSIHLDEDTDVLFAYLERTDNHTMDSLPDEPVMQEWWAYMKHLMQYDGPRPRVVPLFEMFHMA